MTRQEYKLLLFSRLPRRHRVQVGPQAPLACARVRFSLLHRRISWRILSIPPAPALFDQLVISVGAIVSFPVKET